MIEFSSTEYTRFAQLVQRLSGIELNAGKQQLATARLQPRLRALACATFSDYLVRVEADKNEAASMLDVISTNVTSFWREPDHFPLLAQHLKQWIDQGATRIRLWCAAAATGEEPWTMAMLLRDAIGERKVDGAILATDISSRALATAEAGIYPKESTAKMPAELRNRHFTATPDGQVKIGDHLRQLVVFNRLNLVRPPWPMRGTFDAIFCRNVMIYFDLPTKQAVIDPLTERLAPHGIMLLGGAETLSGLRTPLASFANAAYRR